MTHNPIHISGFRPQLGEAFARLNLDWIATLFAVEEADLVVLHNPQSSIIDRGGSILFALEGEIAVGCVALKPVRDGELELTKMAVREDQRGRGTGALLMQAALVEARHLGAHTLVLDTHSSLLPAIALYRSFGFEQVPLRKSPYQRTDVSMRCSLAGEALYAVPRVDNAAESA